MLADRQRRGEARRFDAEEMDEARAVMGQWPMKGEVLRRRSWWHDLRPDAGKIGLQCTVLQTRPVSAHRCVESVAARWVDGIADLVDPLDVGAEPRLAAEIER